MQSTSFRGVSLGLIRKFSRQILSALSYLRSHGVVHCDLKPENVLLCATDRSAVKLIDFGSSCWVGDKESAYAQSRFYRAPEVILGLPYGCPVDMWSLGCIMVELHSGKPLFPGQDERDQLQKIREGLGIEMAGTCARNEWAAHCPAATDGTQRQSEGCDARGAGAGAGARVSAGGKGRLGSAPPGKHAPGVKPLRATIVAAARTFQSRRVSDPRIEEEEEEEVVLAQAVNHSRGPGRAAVEMDFAQAAVATMSLVELGTRDIADTGDFDGGRKASSATTTAAAELAAAHGLRPTSSLDNLTEVTLFCELVESLLTYSADDRLTPEDALALPFFSAAAAAPPPPVIPAGTRATRGFGWVGGGGSSGSGMYDNQDTDADTLMCLDSMPMPHGVAPVVWRR